MISDIRRRAAISRLSCILAHVCMRATISPRGGGGPGGQDFGGPPNFIKRGKTLCACARKRRVLVLNSYPDPPPPFRNPVSAPG